MGIDHASLVDDEEIAVEEVIAAPFEAPRGEIHFEESVDGESLSSCDLGEPFSRPSGWSREEDFACEPFGDPQDRVSVRAFSRSGAPCDDMDLIGESLDDGLFLLGGEADFELFFGPVGRLDCVD